MCRCCLHSRVFYFLLVFLVAALLDAAAALASTIPKPGTHKCRDPLHISRLHVK